MGVIRKFTQRALWLYAIEAAIVLIIVMFVRAYA